MNDIKIRLDELKEIISKANYEYYTMDNPTLSDYDYDMYMKELLDIELEEFKKHILDLIYDQELYKSISMNAKNSTYSYSKEVFASRVLQVYHRAIENKKLKS